MEPGVTIMDAMDKFHFNSPSHFNRFCRQYFDKTPGTMIKEAKAPTNKRDKRWNKSGNGRKGSAR
jgi:AraC-like DNA-binding protein